MHTTKTEHEGRGEICTSVLLLRTEILLAFNQNAPIALIFNPKLLKG